ncbi:MAG TPA: NAD(P)H-binding protein [Jiangellaceae bacterium]
MMVVTGATGNVGAELVRALAGEGASVRALVRDPDHVVLPSGVQPVTGDLNRPETMTEALAGARGVFLLPGYADMPGLLDQVRAAGAERVVLLSGGSAGSGDLTNAVSRYMIISERAVRDSGVPWTIVRARAFMSNALRWLPQLQAGDEVRVPFPGVTAAAIDPYDIAAVVAKALLSEGHEGRTYVASGPEAILPADQVAVLAEVLGRDLRFVGLTDAEARVELEASMPVEYVDAFFDFYVDGTLDESGIEPTVQEVTGRAPRTFRQWVQEHADAFR